MMTNHFNLTVFIEFTKLGKPGLSYHKPKIFFNSGAILVHFYRIYNMTKPGKISKDEYALKRIKRANDYRSLMESNNWNQAELARHLGVSKAWVTNVLKNK
ncbi:MAG: XRE family transcriptional regulator [Calditrichaeota bacterium]|nr:MAG: XRE family transcriptional regulator [Calditrichota bacterium]MBL1204771.1 XRE family transcriptional regulator [Calditrichota bacterium]NOG44599.1 helix-turn-helix transcriptional regulator [Calditrichota bacterium]